MIKNHSWKGLSICLIAVGACFMLIPSITKEGTSKIAIGAILLVGMALVMAGIIVLIKDIKEDIRYRKKKK